MVIAVAIYFLAGIGLIWFCTLLSKAMLQAHAWLVARRRKPNAMLAEIEATFSKAWEASER